MATVATIAGLLSTVLGALDGIDQTSIYGYLPPVKTDSIALVIPALGQQTQVITNTPARGTRIKYHRIQCEFWVKVNAGNADNATILARDIGLTAIEALLVNDALNNESYKIGHYGSGTPQFIEAQVADAPIVVKGVDYVVVTVFVPIVDYSG